MCEKQAKNWFFKRTHFSHFCNQTDPQDCILFTHERQRAELLQTKQPHNGVDILTNLEVKPQLYSSTNPTINGNI
ncbi:hypothetical protein BpHYR1_047140 [Brachionus plicatilis]|uniref:Uncharacterized protein n=1 Tax=Brachionus plicatilis TaxID=10195 RepID=A0A3M7PF31_BRAPC|nr:hypothetical protein BpHYR1_047140 [Brachionus plicatilis]